MSQYVIYHHTHSRKEYEQTDYLCFICATKAATASRHATRFGSETIHPVLVKEGIGHRTECTGCGRKLNWMDT